MSMKMSVKFTYKIAKSIKFNGANKLNSSKNYSTTKNNFFTKNNTISNFSLNKITINHQSYNQIKLLNHQQQRRHSNSVFNNVIAREQFKNKDDKSEVISPDTKKIPQTLDAINKIKSIKAETESNREITAILRTDNPLFKNPILFDKIDTDNLLFVRGYNNTEPDNVELLQQRITQANNKGMKVSLALNTTNASKQETSSQKKDRLVNSLLKLKGVSKFNTHFLTSHTESESNNPNIQFQHQKFLQDTSANIQLVCESVKEANEKGGGVSHIDLNITPIPIGINQMKLDSSLKEQYKKLVSEEINQFQNKCPEVRLEIMVANNEQNNDIVQEVYMDVRDNIKDPSRKQESDQNKISQVQKKAIEKNSEVMLKSKETKTQSNSEEKKVENENDHTNTGPKI